MTKKQLITLYCILCVVSDLHAATDWQLGPFERAHEANPILTPSRDSEFFCPIQDINIRWEAEHLFNPGAVVREGKVYLFYRAEDDYGDELGRHTSRIGLAESSDGIHFRRMSDPILFPDHDGQSAAEFPGGCEDPRVVETEEGTYVMLYTQWNHKVAVLGVATSSDLIHWKKLGYAFHGSMRKRWSKSGSIVCRREGDRMIATKVHGKYWMYWGEGEIYAATSDDLISWSPMFDEEVGLKAVVEIRKGHFDSLLVEAGPPALITEQGIVLIYNGKNSLLTGDRTLTSDTYSLGQVLIDINDPTQVVDRCKRYFLTPEKTYEMKGQYGAGAVFAQGLVHFQDRWLLYYGGADSVVGVAINTDR